MCKSKTAEPKGLCAEVRKILEKFTGVSDIVESSPVGYKGEPKVKIPRRWPRRRPSIEVCDGTFGKRTLIVHAEQPGAILRLLGTKLAEKNIALA